MKFQHMVFDVEDRRELAAAITERLEQLGYRFSKVVAGNTLIVTDSDGMFWRSSDWKATHTLSDLSDLYDMEKTHTIIVDGKTIEISEESFAKLKESLVGAD